MLIIVTKTNYGYRAETATRSTLTPDQTKRINKFIQGQQVKENNFNTFNR